MLTIPLLLALAALAQPQSQPAAAPSTDPSLVLYFGTTVGSVQDNKAVDASGKVSAVISGQPVKEALGPSEGYRFNGKTDFLTIENAPAILPKREFTASAWVSLNELTQYGGIIGNIMDDGGAEGGWALGYNTEHFTFALASKGAADADGKLTYLEGKTAITPGKWYHVAAVYDGATMKLYVNGKLDGESSAQSGEIFPPAKPVPFTIAAFKDANETHPMDGTLLEVRLHSRPLPENSFTAEAVAGARLLSYDPPYSQSQKFLVPPYLQRATKESILISWETSRPARGYVEYGEKLPYDKKTELGPLGTMHEIKLDGLKPQFQYFYRVHTIADPAAAPAAGNTAGATGSQAETSDLVSEQLTFRTAVEDDMPFAFVAIGDTQKNAAVIKTLQDFAFTLRPNFEIHLGDVVNEGPDKNEWTKEFFAGSARLLGRVPIFPTIGNHEKNHSLYYQYFNLPAPEYRYTYTYGNAQFFVIDTNKPVDPGSEQYKWLDEELGKSTATWKFCYHHHTVWCSDEDDYGDTYKEQSTWGDARHRHLAALYEKHHVDIAFNGHVHAYERTWPILGDKIDHKNGVIYITSGGGGGGLESVAPARTWFQKRTYRGHHLTYVMIHQDRLDLQAFDLEGRLFDSMSIRKNDK